VMVWLSLVMSFILCVCVVRPQDASAYEASQEIAYLDNVIQESLRLYPPATRYIWLT
jgi:cytochrome P450